MRDKAASNLATGEGDERWEGEGQSCFQSSDRGGG